MAIFVKGSAVPEILREEGVRGVHKGYEGVHDTENIAEHRPNKCFSVRPQCVLQQGKC